MNAHLGCVNHCAGGRLWAGHGPCSVQPLVLFSLCSLPSYSLSIAHELVTFLPQLPTQAMVNTGAAATRRKGSTHPFQPQAGEVRKSHLSFLPPRHLGETGGCFSMRFLHFCGRDTVPRQAGNDQRQPEPSQ